MSKISYPPSGFFFSVQIFDLHAGRGTPPTDSVSFQDVSGLSVEVETETVTEGGQNSYRHRLPTIAKYGDLVLKRGLVTETQPLFTWCKETLQDGLAAAIVPKLLLLQLLGYEFEDENDEKPKLVIRRQWAFSGVWPTKWILSDFNSMKDELVIETLTLSYRTFETLAS